MRQKQQNGVLGVWLAVLALVGMLAAVAWFMMRGGRWGVVDQAGRSATEEGTVRVQVTPTPAVYGADSSESLMRELEGTVDDGGVGEMMELKNEASGL